MSDLFADLVAGFCLFFFGVAAGTTILAPAILFDACKANGYYNIDSARVIHCEGMKK